MLLILGGLLSCFLVDPILNYSVWFVTGVRLHVYAYIHTHTRKVHTYTYMF